MEMATHGSLSAFDPSKEDWTSYTDRMKHYFIANDVTDGDKKRSILLSACGASTFKLIQNLVEKDKVNTTSFEDIVAKLKTHYDPEPSVIMQRYKFNTRTRAEGESVANYVAALRELAQHCDYNDTLSDMLRDRLVCGVKHKGITNRLLNEKKLTYEKALELAQAMETAEKDTRHLQTTQSAPEVHHNTSQKRGTGQKKQPAARQGQRGATQLSCYRCGGDHLPTKCRFKDTVCHACKKRGHIVKVCRSRVSQGRPTRRTHYVDEEDLDPQEEGDSVYSLFALKSEACEPIIKNVTINGVSVEMELDTGAAFTVITQMTYQKIAQQKHINCLEYSDLKLKSYSGELIPVFGQVAVKVNYGQQECELCVHIVDGDGPDLMGRDWIKALGVTFKLGEIHSIEESKSLHDVLEKHSTLFEEKLGYLKGTEIKLNVDSNATPKFFKARSVPLALKGKVEAELDKLESMGIISPVQFSRWAAPIVPVLKQNGAVGICGDYKVTINQASLVDTYPLPRIDELLANLSGGKHFSKLDMSQAYLQLPLDKESREYVTVNTPKGLYEYNRLPFGVSSAPSIFQRTMDNLLQGIKGVSVYVDAYILSTISSSKTIETLRTVFATHGLPQTIVTDNGSSFTSEEFKQFMEKNGIKHITSAPYHPSSNGQAERAVQTLKQGIKRTPGESVQERMSRFLFDYRITPHATTGVAPCELLMNRKLRSRFELLYPMVRRKVEKCQEKQKELHDGKRDVRQFALQDPVYIENFTSRKPKWIPGTIVKVTGPLSYVIELQNGITVRRHVDSIRKRESLNSEQDSDAEEPGFELIGVPVEPEPQSQEPENVPGEEPDAQPRVRRSTRSRQPPERYGQ